MAVGGIVGHQGRLRHPLIQKLVDEITLHQCPVVHVQAGHDAVRIERLVPVTVMLKAQQIEHTTLIVEPLLGEAQSHLARRTRAPGVVKNEICASHDERF